MDFTWITAGPESEVIDQRHPDWEYWAETFAHEDAIGDPTPPKMPEPVRPVAVPPVALALSREQAAEALSVGLDWFDTHVKPHIRVITKGRRVLVPVSELERYVNENAARALR